MSPASRIMKKIHCFTLNKHFNWVLRYLLLDLDVLGFVSVVSVLLDVFRWEEC